MLPVIPVRGLIGKHEPISRECVLNDLDRARILSQDAADSVAGPQNADHRRPRREMQGLDLLWGGHAAGDVVAQVVRTNSVNGSQFPPGPSRQLRVLTDPSVLYKRVRKPQLGKLDRHPVEKEHEAAADSPLPLRELEASCYLVRRVVRATDIHHPDLGFMALGFGFFDEVTFPRAHLHHRHRLADEVSDSLGGVDKAFGAKQAESLADGGWRSRVLFAELTNAGEVLSAYERPIDDASSDPIRDLAEGRLRVRVHALLLPRLR